MTRVADPPGVTYDGPYADGHYRILRHGTELVGTVTSDNHHTPAGRHKPKTWTATDSLGRYYYTAPNRAEAVAALVGWLKEKRP